MNEKFYDYLSDFLTVETNEKFIELVKKHIKIIENNKMLYLLLKDWKDCFEIEKAELRYNLRWCEDMNILKIRKNCKKIIIECISKILYYEGV